MVLTTKPAKIIAVHLNYLSRMQQRGRTPNHPSYFLKPSSSLASSGAAVERPRGTELLAFEGEIALIIGKKVKNITRENAWEVVSHVTAANDFGIYDLRQADKGSNLRSKGRDAYTPLGPALIGVNGFKETGFRVRTWVNGELVQEGTSDTLKFSFSELIADLASHMTLEVGDIILTGTPAGSSVVVPGDTVEVEVDYPQKPGISSGKLVTKITQGDHQIDRWGASPEIDDRQREEAWGKKKSAAGSPLTPAIRKMLENVAVATVSAALRKRGFTEIFIDGVKPVKESDRILGTAKTLRFVPYRPDLFEKFGGGFNAQKRAFDSVAEGEVIVIEARGVTETGTVGDVLALRAEVRGAAGIVTDGGVRDFREVKGFEIPVFSQGAHPSVLGRRHIPWEIDTTISCGGAAVQPGDIIMGDCDGVIVIPPHLLEEVALEAHNQEAEDSWIAEQVRSGAPVDGLFPMNAAWREKYDEAKKRE